MILETLTKNILVNFFQVYNELGTGFLESTYRESLRFALEDVGVHAEREVPIEVLFRGRVAGRCYADLVVAHSVILEVKVARSIIREHETQLLHYLQASNIEVGLLLNFGPSPQFKRLVCSNDRKKSLSTKQPARSRENPR
jgi:GxxExxY protein